MTQATSVRHDSVDDVQDSDEIAVFPEQNWFQTLVTIPLLTASAGAVFMLLPVSDSPKTTSAIQTANASSFGLALRDPSFRQHQGVVARMENDRNRLRFTELD